MSLLKKVYSREVMRSKCSICCESLSKAHVNNGHVNHGHESSSETRGRLALVLCSVDSLVLLDFFLVTLFITFLIYSVSGSH